MNETEARPTIDSDVLFTLRDAREKINQAISIFLALPVNQNSPLRRYGDMRRRLNLLLEEDWDSLSITREALEKIVQRDLEAEARFREIWRPGQQP